MDITLNGHEARVLGVLIEKAFTTPDQYPLSLNGATNGSNQKSNRDPQVSFSEAETRIALQGLQMKGLAGGSRTAGSRVEKYRHNAKEMLKVGERAIAVVAELLLRGPQTAGEIRTRAKRMRDIPSLGDLDEVLAELESAGLVRPLTGGRATKYTQLLCGELHPDGESAAAPPASSVPASSVPAASVSAASAPTASAAAAPAPAAGALEARVASLESQVSALTETVEALRAELGA